MRIQVGWNFRKAQGADAARLFIDFAMGIFLQLELSSGRTTEAPQWHSRRRGEIPEVDDHLTGIDSTALFAAECQSFLNNLVAQIPAHKLT